MLKIIRLATLAVVLIAGHACAGKTIAALGQQFAGKKIAVASISANNWGNTLQGWNSSDTTDLMTSRLNQMLDYTETLLAKDWTVVAAKDFVGKPEFYQLAGEQREVGLPRIGDRDMPLFSKNRKQLIKAQVDKDVAIKLCAATGADLVVLVYSEWTVATGKFVPTSKALTKNVVGIFDAKGKQVYSGRKDTVGRKTLGGLGKVVVNKDTIDQWVAAYKMGIDDLYGASAQ